MDYCCILIIITTVSQLVYGASKYYDGVNRPYEFGFNIEGNQHRHESKDANGVIMGEFGFITADGVYHVTAYATDENGNFKILFMKNIKIGLPGNQTKNALGLPTKPQRPATMQPDLAVRTPSSKGIGLVKVGPMDTRACSGCAIPKEKLDAKIPPIERIATKMPAYLMDIITANRTPIANSFGTNDQDRSSPALNNDSANRGQDMNRESVERGRTLVNSAQQKPQANIKANEQSLAKAQFDQTGSSRSGNANFSGRQGIIPGGDRAHAAFNPRTSEKSYASHKAPKAIDKSFDNAVHLQRNRGNFDDHKLSDQSGVVNPQINAGSANSRKAADQVGRQRTNNEPGKSPIYPINREALEEMRKALVGLLYKFNYTAGYHGHHEQGDRAGAKDGGYFFTGRDSLQRNVEYVANDFGYQPYITQVQVGENETPSKGTEKEAGLKGYEFKWFSERE